MKVPASSVAPSRSTADLQINHSDGGAKCKVKHLGRRIFPQPTANLSSVNQYQDSCLLLEDKSLDIQCKVNKVERCAHLLASLFGLHWQNGWTEKSRRRLAKVDPRLRADSVPSPRPLDLRRVISEGGKLALLPSPCHVLDVFNPWPPLVHANRRPLFSFERGIEETSYSIQRE